MSCRWATVDPEYSVHQRYPKQFLSEIRKKNMADLKCQVVIPHYAAPASVYNYQKAYRHVTINLGCLQGM